MKCQMSWSVKCHEVLNDTEYKVPKMPNVSFCGKCHQMSNVLATFWNNFCIFLGQFLPYFRNCWGIFHNYRQLLTSCHLLASIRNFSRLGNFGIVLLFFASFGNLCHVLAAFDNFWQIWQFLATVGNFKHLWADFGIFLATFGFSHILLATFMNLLSL